MKRCPLWCRWPAKAIRPSVPEPCACRGPFRGEVAERRREGGCYVGARVGKAGVSMKDRGEGLAGLTASAAPEAGRAVAELIDSADPPPELVARAFGNLSHRLFSEWIELRKDPAVIA